MASGVMTSPPVKVTMRDERQFVSEATGTISVLAANGTIVSFRQRGDDYVIRVLLGETIAEVGFGFWDRALARSWLLSACEVLVPGLLRNSRRSVAVVIGAMVESGFEFPDATAVPPLGFEQYHAIIRRRGV